MAESQRDEIAKLESLYSANPEGRIFTHLAEAYRKAGDLERARETVERGLRRHPDYSSAHVVLGRILLDQRDPRGAEEAFRRVLALDPENRVALRAVADLARDDGRTAEALGYYREILLLDPTDEAVEAIARELEAQVAEAAGPVGDPGVDRFEAGFGRDGYGYGGGIDFDVAGPDPFAGPADVGGEAERSGSGWVEFEPIDIGPSRLSEGWLDLGSISLTTDAASATDEAALGEVAGGSGGGDAVDAVGVDFPRDEAESLPSDVRIDGFAEGEPEGDAAVAWPADAVWSDGHLDEPAVEGAFGADLEGWRDDADLSEPLAAAEAEDAGEGEAVAEAGAFGDELLLDEVVEEEAVHEEVPVGAVIGEELPGDGLEREESLGEELVAGGGDAREEVVAESVGREEILASDSGVGEVVADGAGTAEAVGDPTCGAEAVADEAVAEAVAANEVVVDAAVERDSRPVEGGLRGEGDAFGPVVTETMAELYAGQGLYARAAEVYRELLRGRPDDERLRAKLREAELGEEATRARVAPMAGRPISAYLRGLLGYVVAPRETVAGGVRLGDESADLEATIDEDSDEAILILDESMVVEEAAEEDEFDRLFARSSDRNPPAAPMATETPAPAAGASSPTPPPPADPKGSASGSAGEDDDDLEMFRAWLQNLKR